MPKTTVRAVIDFHFDGKNLAAQAAAQQHGLVRMAGIAKETKKALRLAIVRAINEGIPPYEAARAIANIVGLASSDAQAVMNYRESLINAGTGVDRADLLAARLSRRKLKGRAVAIARTETMLALNKGAVISWRQAQKKGLIGRLAKKEWIVTPDDRLCPICAPLDGAQTEINRTFDGGLEPPAHTLCRCTVGIIPGPIGLRAEA